MKIRNKITLRFTLVVFAILGSFSISVYFLSANYRHEQFYSRLSDRAFTTAKLFIDVSEVDSMLLRIIDKNTVVLPMEKVEIYNLKNQKIYCSIENDVSVVSPEILDRLYQQKEVRYEEGDKEFLGVEYHTDVGEFLIIASALDKYGKNRISHLRTILLLGMLISTLLSMISGWVFSGLVLKPISRVIEQVDSITARNMNVRVDEGTGKDEISQLAFTFNKMLNRLEEAFEVQKSFVSNASHELRTPLTSITGQIEVTLMNERTTDEYKVILQSIDEDIKQLNLLSNGLLELTYLNMDVPNIDYSLLRIDELLWTVRSEYLKQKPEMQVEVEFTDFSENEKDLIYEGSEHLLKILLKNLIENGCKFSNDHKVSIQLENNQEAIVLHFINIGNVIPDEDISKIFLPFYRSTNSGNVSGHGLGLSLVKRIADLHRCRIEVKSKDCKTVFSLLFDKGKV